MLGVAIQTKYASINSLILILKPAGFIFSEEAYNLLSLYFSSVPYIYYFPFPPYEYQNLF